MLDNIINEITDDCELVNIEAITKNNELYIKGNKIPKNIKGAELIDDRVFYKLHLCNTGRIKSEDGNWIKLLKKDDIVFNIEVPLQNIEFISYRRTHVLQIIIPKEYYTERW